MAMAMQQGRQTCRAQTTSNIVEIKIPRSMIVGLRLRLSDQQCHVGFPGGARMKSALHNIGGAHRQPPPLLGVSDDCRVSAVAVSYQDLHRKPAFPRQKPKDGRRLYSRPDKNYANRCVMSHPTFGSMSKTHGNIRTLIPQLWYQWRGERFIPSCKYSRVTSVSL